MLLSVRKSMRPQSRQQDEQTQLLNHHITTNKTGTCNSSTSKFVIVRGIRYVVPYLKNVTYSVRDDHAGKSVASVLAHAFHRRHNELADTMDHFEMEVQQGRISLQRHRQSRNDTRPFASSGFTTVTNAHMETCKQDRIRMVQHVHERCSVDRGPVRSLYTSGDGVFRAVWKPAGMHVVDDCGGYNTVTGVLADVEGETLACTYRLGHRLDLPVCGVLLLAKGRGNSKKLMEALGPEAKRREGVLKAYVARVSGRMQVDSPSGVAMLVRLKWDSHAKKAVVVHGEKEGRETNTRVVLLQYDASVHQSVLRVELMTGARQQVRAVLAHMGLPIVGDVLYGGLDPPNAQADNQRLRLYADDDKGSLLNMLSREYVDWCDKCRWQMDAVKNGGTTRGTERLCDYICLLSYHYRIPSLGIDVRVPVDMIPSWAAAKDLRIGR